MRRALLPFLVSVVVGCGPAPAGSDDGRRHPPAVVDPGDDVDPLGGLAVATAGSSRPGGSTLWGSAPVDTGDPSALDPGEADTGGEGSPPSCRVLVPADGAHVPSQHPIRFEGEVLDADDDVQMVFWSSDVWGAMVIGTEFDFILPVGPHVVTMRADDAMGHACEAQVRIVVVR